MVSRRMKRPSTSTVLRKTHIKEAMGHHFTSVRGTQNKRSSHLKCWQEYGGKGILIHVKGHSHLGKQSGNIC